MEQRKYQFEQGKKLKHIQFREALYPFFVKFLVVDRIFRKQTITVIGNQKNTKNLLFMPVHILVKMIWRIFLRCSIGAAGGLLAIRVCFTKVFLGFCYI